MPLVLIKRQNGDAWLAETREVERSTIEEGATRLSPDDLVDGKKVRDWEPGVYTVMSVVWEGAAERFTDWTSETLSPEGEEGGDEEE